MDGRVLSEEEIREIEESIKMSVITDLITTIRYKNELLNDLGKTCVIQQEQNTTLREALKFYAKEDNWIGDGNIRHFDRPYGVAREALAKVGELK